MAQRATEDDAPPAGGPLKVIYIMGAGRSGSTILGVALGNCDGVFFAGELDRWLPRGGVPRGEGEQLQELWRRVRQRADVPESLFATGTPSLERSSALFDVRKWPRRRRLRARYRQASERVYRALAETTGASHIVDSSHYPMRLREMRTLPGIELYLVYLMRNPRAVVASLGRSDVRERRFGTVAANAYLWLTSLLSVSVFLGHPYERRLFVRYEDLVSNPDRVLSAILRRAGSSAEVPDLDRLSTNLPFHGNRLIESDLVRLERVPAGVPGDSRLTTALQSPWQLLARRLRPAA